MRWLGLHAADFGHLHPALPPSLFQPWTENDFRTFRIQITHHAMLAPSRAQEQSLHPAAGVSREELIRAEIALMQATRLKLQIGACLVSPRRHAAVLRNRPHQPFSDAPRCTDRILKLAQPDHTDIDAGPKNLPARLLVAERTR